MTRAAPAKPDYLRRSRIAAGAAIVALVFIVETYAADRAAPNAASPFVWGALGAAAAGALAYAAWCRLRARAP